MRSLAYTTLLLAACNFNPRTENSLLDVTTDADPNAPDADPNAPDADPNAPDADPSAPDAAPDPNCGWGYDPVYFDPCGDPPGALNPLVLDFVDVPGLTLPYTYDTSTDMLTSPLLASVGHTSTIVNGNRILWTSSFKITALSRLRVTGAMPLVIASKSNIDIDGTLSVASFFDDDSPRLGAGSEPQACMQDGAEEGDICEHGGAGGGGGAFSGAGGTGGDGGLGHEDCVNRAGEIVTESAGGEGGGTAEVPTMLRGGCAGRDGGEGKMPDFFGIGAPGGGAIHLIAAATLKVRGRIHAGGAGGRKSTGERSAGGGGGSGGMIGVEATTIDLAATAVLSANGGGGGGGANGSGASDGENAPVDGSQAEGGDPEPDQGTAGGAGGWRNAPAGGSATPTAVRGGGGGGGGAGYILYYQDTTPVLNALISPAALSATTISP